MKRKWKILALVTAALAVVLVVPVFVAQSMPSSARQLQGMRLADTSYGEVRFSNASQGLELAGMLFVPQGAGPFPAVVIIHGSGTSHRDNSWYLTLAADLVRRGIVVLMPDKRGSEQSQGDWRTASLDDLAGDTAAAVSFLRHQDQVAVSQLGIVGLSQGGHLAPLAAARSPDVSFLVNVVGSAVPLRDGLWYEEQHNLRQLGLLPGVSHLVACLSTSYLVHVAQKDFWNAIGDLDPLPYWKRLEIPALVLYGENDTNVNSSQSAARLRSLDKPNIEVCLYAGSGHALEDPPGAGERIWRTDALDRIGQFIATNAQSTAADAAR